MPPSAGPFLATVPRPVGAPAPEALLRANACEATMALVDAWCATSTTLARVFPQEARAAALRATLRELNAQLEARQAHECVVHPCRGPTSAASSASWPMRLPC